MRPPYRVPSMAEIEATPWNGFYGVSTFSGAGGSSLGYRLAGFRMLWASEFVEAAADTYRANMSPCTVLDTRDIRDVSAADVLRATGLKPGEIHLLDGSPPCAAFSTSGRREAAWGVVRPYSDTRQRVDDLFGEFVRLLTQLQPATFIAENVSGLVHGRARGYFLLILRALQDAGYRVSCRMVDSRWLGVPQRRRRLIFVGVRDDLGMDPVHPKPLPYEYTVRDAIDGLPGAFEDLAADPETGHPLSLRGYALEHRWNEIEPGQTHPRRLNLKRMHYDEPCPTVVATPGKCGTAALTHPEHPRYPSLGELRRLSSFPDDFALTGDFGRRWERIGRAVPPLMMARVAEVVRDEILVPLRAAGRL